MNVGLPIGIALSGGGVRAMAFHAGVLRWLAETKRMEEVTHISSVSGGTLAAGLVFALSDWKWPSSRQYLDKVRPEFMRLLTTHSLAAEALNRLAWPHNWRFVFSRANIVSQAIERSWGIDERLSRLPPTPVWSINGTTAETGRRFRFKQDRCGDYEIGYADASHFKISDAMAVSAAFPGLIGPLAIKTAHYKWKRRPTWNAPAETEREVVLPFKRLHIYDGGVYDNLGLEPLMDPAAQRFKNGIGYVVCSDAGAPLARERPSFFVFRRVTRLLDIVMDQARALRVRALANFLTRNPTLGTYAQIGANATERLHQYEHLHPSRAARLLQREWLGADDVVRAARVKTTLSRLKTETFQLLELHGYESMMWNEAYFGGHCLERT